MNSLYVVGYKGGLNQTDALRIRTVTTEKAPTLEGAAQVVYEDILARDGVAPTIEFVAYSTPDYNGGYFAQNVETILRKVDFQVGWEQYFVPGERGSTAAFQQDGDPFS